jgi:PhnB protein
MPASSTEEAEMASTARKGVPAGYRTATPYLMITDPEAAVTFYRTAFGAVELARSIDAGGVLRNIQIRIGDAPVMLGVRAPTDPLTEQRIGDLPLVSIYLYVADADRVFSQAVAAGALALYPPENQEYGNREGGIVDPFGVTWWIATHFGKHPDKTTTTHDQ